MLHLKAKPNRGLFAYALRFSPASPPTEVMTSSGNAPSRFWHRAGGAILLALCVAGLTATPASAALQTIETQHFIVSYDDEKDASLVTDCAEVAERAYAELGGAFGYYPSAKVGIEILPEEPPLRSGKGRSGRAHTTDDGGQITLVSPRVFGFAETARTGIYHEYWHIVSGHLTQGRIPRWFDEGCAVLVARQLSPGYGEYLKDAVESGKLMSFGELEKFFSSPEKIDLSPAYLAYAECCTVIEYFLDVYGQAKLKALLAELKENDMETAFEHVTQNRLPEFEESWKRSLQRGKWGQSYLGNRAFSRVRAKPLGALGHKELSIKNLAENRDRVKVTGLTGYEVFVETPSSDQQGRSFLAVNEKRIAVYPPLFGEGTLLIEETKDGLLLTMPDGSQTHLNVQRRISF
jgi:hypothetical protein